jgi:hypothetical protein
MSGDKAVREQIERSIVEARGELSDKIDQLDRKLRAELDLKKIASEHAIQLVGAGAAVGFVLGFGVPRAILRMLQIGVPIGLAVVIARRVHERQEAETGEGA